MFGGGAKKDKKDDEDRGDNSGSAKAQRDAAVAAKGEEVCLRCKMQLLVGTSTDTNAVLRVGGGSRERGCPLRARDQAHREG